jgi:hypothetical protein
MDENSNNETPAYPSHAKAGLGIVELPQPDLTNIAEGMFQRSDMRQQGRTDRIQARSFGSHVAQRVEAVFQQRGPVSAAAVLSHYIECGKHVLLDPFSARQLRALTNSMTKSNQPEEFYRRSVRPFLLGLMPAERGQQ